jgi:hypothetical protein
MAVKSKSPQPPIPEKAFANERDLHPWLNSHPNSITNTWIIFCLSIHVPRRNQKEARTYPFSCVIGVLNKICTVHHGGASKEIKPTETHETDIIITHIIPEKKNPGGL